MNLTNKQYVAISMAVLAFLAASAGQMAEFLGPTPAKSIASGASFINGILASIMGVLLGQGAIVQEVRSMPGVENIEVNRRASPVLASLAIDPIENKISSKVGDERVIQATANT